MTHPCDHRDQWGRDRDRANRVAFYAELMAACADRCAWRHEFKAQPGIGNRAMQNLATGEAMGRLRAYELCRPRYWSMSAETFEWLYGVATGHLDHVGGNE